MNQMLIQNNEQQQKNVGPFDFKTKFSFLEAKWFQLPQRINCDIGGNYKPEDLLISDKPELLRQATNMILANFYDKMKVWDFKNDFKFNLPPSYFNAKVEFKDNQDQIKVIFYYYIEEINRLEGTFLVKYCLNILKWQNIAQIFQTGTFTVQSANFTLPFIWKISGWIIKGRENIIKSYYDDLSLAYYLFRQSYERLYHESDYEVCGCNFTIRAGIVNILIVNILLIKIEISAIYFNDYRFQETKSTTNDGAALHLEQSKFSQAIYTYLSASKENSDKLNNHIKQFQKIADAIKFQVYNLVKLKNEKKYFSQVDEPIELNDQARQELKLPQDYLRQYNLQFDPNQIADQKINDFQYEAQKKYWQRIKAILYYSIYKQSIDAIENQHKTELQGNNPIRSRIKEYVQEEIECYMNPIKLKLQTEMETNILKEFKEQQLIDRFLYQDYLEFKNKNAKELVNKIGNILTLFQHKNVFLLMMQQRKIMHLNWFDKNLITYQQNIHFGNYISIQLTIIQRIQIQLTFYINIAIYGQLGLKVLFGSGIFYSVYKVDIQTGIVGPSGKEIKTISYRLKEVYEGMKNSRNNFEQQIDNGFSNKSILRIVNLVEVYFFRFTFIGIFCLCICFPLLILIKVSISLILGLTSVVYLPIIFLLFRIFTIFVFDLHYEDDNLGQKYQSIWHYDIGFPIITNSLRLVFQGVLQLVFAIMFGFVIFPILSILIIVFAHLRYFLATLCDFFMICIISCLGRMPTEDSCLAWRISGPGINKQYYNQLSIENVLLLIAVEIGKVILINYKAQIEFHIDQALKDTNGLINLQFPHVSFYDPGSVKLKQLQLWQLEAQYQNHLKFDINLKVRYTENELKHLLDQVKQLLKSQIMLKIQKLVQWDYNALTKRLVTDVLGQQVFEPIQENELKFLLYQSKDQELLIQQALEGQVDFKMPDKKDDVVVNQPINFKKFVSFENLIAEIKNCQQQKQTWCSAKTNQGFYINYALK